MSLLMLSLWYYILEFLLFTRNHWLGGAKLHPNASTMPMASNLVVITHIYACAGLARTSWVPLYQREAGPGRSWSC